MYNLPLKDLHAFPVQSLQLLPLVADLSHSPNMCNSLAEVQVMYVCVFVHMQQFSTSSKCAQWDLL